MDNLGFASKCMIKIFRGGAMGGDSLKLGPTPHEQFSRKNQRQKYSE